MRNLKFGLFALGAALACGVVIGAYVLGIDCLRFGQKNEYFANVQVNRFTNSVNDSNVGAKDATRNRQAGVSLGHNNSHGHVNPESQEGAANIKRDDSGGPNPQVLDEFRTVLGEIEIEGVASQEAIEDILAIQRRMNKEELALSMKELKVTLGNVQRNLVSGLPNPDSAVAAIRK
jgi:hypothetical protein